MWLDCSITIKEGLFPLVTIEFPNNEPRDEHIADVLLQKNKLDDLKEIKDTLLTTMEEVSSRPPDKLDLISHNVMERSVIRWDCAAGNVTCGEHEAASATVRYVGALMEIASITVPGHEQNFNNFNVDEWIEKSAST